MKPDIKQNWVKALRSKEYKQGRKQLSKKRKNKAYKFCCLGVLCDLAEKEGVISWTNKGSKYSGQMSRKNSYPSETVLDWAGLTGYHELNALIILNDTSKASFQEIADYIEEHL